MSTATTTATPQSLWSKIGKWNTNPTASTFPELPKVVQSMRLVLGCLYGLYLGYLKQKGFVGIVFAMNIIMFVPILYCQTYLGVVDLDINYPEGNLRFVGLVQAFAWLLITWITLYTIHSAAEQEELSALLASNIHKVVEESVQDDVVEEHVGSDPDSEF